MNILFKAFAGSRLYGTSVPESDTDLRGVYLPSRADCFLDRIRDTISDPTEEDTQLFSLQYFLKLAAQGQSVAIEMIAAPPDKIVVSSPLWDYLHANRRRFFTRNMNAFLGFAKSMASKYSSRAERLNETQAILDVILDDPEVEWDEKEPRLSTIWDKLPESINAVKTVNERNGNHDKRVYVVCGREIQATVTIAHAYSVIRTIYDSYGERVRNAQAGNVDWKSVSHAYRVAYQALEIVETGDLTYPLSRADWLRDMRLGKMDFFKDELDAKLYALIAEVQAKIDASDLPDSVDQAWLDKIVLDTYGQEG